MRQSKHILIVLAILFCAHLKLNAQKEQSKNLITLDFTKDLISGFNSEGTAIQRALLKEAEGAEVLEFKSLTFISKGTMPDVSVKINKEEQRSVSNFDDLQKEINDKASSISQVQLIFKKDGKSGALNLSNSETSAATADAKNSEEDPSDGKSICELTGEEVDYFVQPFMKDENTILSERYQNASAFYQLVIDETLYNAPLVQKYVRNKDSIYESSQVKSIRMGKILDVKVQSHLPNYDSIGLSFDFYNYFLDNQEDFNKAFGFMADSGEGDDTASTEENETEKGEKELTGPEKKQVKAIELLERELGLFYDFLKTKRPENEYMSESWNGIKINIKTCFVGLKKVESMSFIDFVKVMDLGEEVLATAKKTGNWISLISRYSAQSVPNIQIKNADELSFKIDYTKSRKIADSRTFDLPVIGGFKIDFSTGLVFSGLTDHSFSAINSDSITIANTDTTTYKQVIREETGDDLDFGVGVLAHFYPRIHHELNFGLTVGANLGENLVSQTLLGVSIMYGRRQRIVLSGGVAFGRVKRLRSIYGDANIQSTLIDASRLDNVTDDQLVKERRGNSFFFSLTWNFGGIRKKLE